VLDHRVGELFWYSCGAVCVAVCVEVCVAVSVDNLCEIMEYESFFDILVLQCVLQCVLHCALQCVLAVCVM